MSLTIGSRLGAYEILSPLGAGGMGEVYRAHDTKVGRDVALKIPAKAIDQRWPWIAPSLRIFATDLQRTTRWPELMKMVNLGYPG